MSDKIIDAEQMNKELKNKEQFNYFMNEAFKAEEESKRQLKIRDELVKKAREYF
jgi:hypothetical protein